MTLSQQNESRKSGFDFIGFNLVQFNASENNNDCEPTTVVRSIFSNYL